MSFKPWEELHVSKRFWLSTTKKLQVTLAFTLCHFYFDTILSAYFSCQGPGSLPGYARRGRGDYDDGASDISSTSGFGSAYGYRSGSRKKTLHIFRDSRVRCDLGALYKKRALLSFNALNL